MEFLKSNAAITVDVKFVEAYLDVILSHLIIDLQQQLGKFIDLQTLVVLLVIGIIY